MRLLGALALGNLLITAFLGLPKYGAPLWEGSRALLLVAGLGLMTQGLLLDGRRAYPWDKIDPNPLLAPGLFSVGLGTAALGLEYLDPARPWSVAAAPGIALIGLLFLREGIRGRSSFIALWSGRPLSIAARTGACVVGVCWPVAVVAVCAASPMR